MTTAGRAPEIDSQEVMVLRSKVAALEQLLDLYERTAITHTEELERAVTERTQALGDANARLAAANHELEAFCYSVSHDLRSPLRGIAGFSQALLEDYEPVLDAQGKKYLNYISQGILRMGTLIDDLLNLSRLSRSELRFENVDLTALARQCDAVLRTESPERVVKFTDGTGVQAQGDPGLLYIVLENLIRNAWKFTGKLAAAEVEFGRAAMRDEGYPVYFVRDNGVGFNMEYSSKLFGAFQRLHSPGEFPGTGIGLATVRRIVNRHGGRVWAEGKEGQGATFFFSLPLRGSAMVR